MIINLSKKYFIYTYKYQLLNSKNLKLISISWLKKPEDSRLFSTSLISLQKLKNDGQQKTLIESSFKDSEVSTNVTGARRAKQAAQDVGYGMILLGGAGLIIGIFYILFSELFSRESPSGIYSESSKICLKDPQIQDAFGHPIKVHTESGGRRVFQIKHKFFVENGQLFMILNYYLEGPRNKGDVFVKCKKNETTGKFEYEHILVKLEYIHHGERKIIVRNSQNDI